MYNAFDCSRQRYVYSAMKNQPSSKRFWLECNSNNMILHDVGSDDVVSLFIFGRNSNLHNSVYL